MHPLSMAAAAAEKEAPMAASTVGARRWKLPSPNKVVLIDVALLDVEELEPEYPIMIVIQLSELEA